MTKTTIKRAANEVNDVIVKIIRTPALTLSGNESRIIPFVAAAIAIESVLTKLTMDIPTPILLASKASCAEGVIETERKLSAIPVMAKATKNTMSGVDGEVNAKGIKLNVTSVVEIAIAFQRLHFCFPTQVPTNAGKAIVIIVRGSNSEPDTVAETPKTDWTTYGPYEFIALK